jgi:G3E family GTPase
LSDRDGRDDVHPGQCDHRLSGERQDHTAPAAARRARARHTAVLVNEFGEVGLDRHLLKRLDEEIVLLQSGCVCCTIRGDLSAAIRDLYGRRERGEIAFRRLVVDTTGLADPVPILSTVMAEPVIRHHFRLGNVVTTIDGVNGLGHLAREEESAKQVAVADRIVITKTDIADAGGIAALRGRLTELNPAAPQLASAPDAVLIPIFC